MDAVHVMVQRSVSSSDATMQAIQHSSSTSPGSAARSLESASRVLKAPDLFDSGSPGDFSTWRHSFLNWLGFADRKMVEMINDVEKLDHGTELEKVDWTDVEDATQDKLYTVLTSYVKGPALQASRSLGDKDVANTDGSICPGHQTTLISLVSSNFKFSSIW